MLSICPQLLNIFDNSFGIFEIPLLICAAVVLLVSLIVGIYFMLTLQNTLKAVSPINRKMKPGKVWLMLIPLFNLVWQFFVITAIADSLESEFLSKGIPSERQPTYKIGIAYAILNCCEILPIPFIKAVIGLALLICFIAYWVKVGEYKNKIIALQSLAAESANSNSIF